jgi:hypothetical protein
VISGNFWFANASGNTKLRRSACSPVARNRATSAAAAAALHLVREVEVIPKAGKAPLFSVWAFRFRARADGARLSSLLLRDAEGNSTEDARMLKKFSGLV